MGEKARHESQGRPPQIHQPGAAGRRSAAGVVGQGRGRGGEEEAKHALKQDEHVVWEADDETADEEIRAATGVITN